MLPVKRTGEFLLNLTTVLGVLMISPSEVLSKWVSAGPKLSLKRSQSSTLPSLATEAKTDEVVGDHSISLTCSFREKI
jgi:hypothetical protein